jgi:hypothetical protein
MKAMQRLASVLWRVLKVMPVVGYIFVLASIPAVLRRKGYVLGLLYVTLEILPLISVLKAGIEIYTGDLIPDKSKAV